PQPRDERGARIQTTESPEGNHRAHVTPADWNDKAIFRAKLSAQIATKSGWREAVPANSPTMIRMPGKYRRGAVDLLQQHDAHQLMRPCGGTERQAQIRFLAQARR